MGLSSVAVCGGGGWKKDNAFGGPKGPVMMQFGYADELEIMLRKAPLGTRFIFCKLGSSCIDRAKKWLEEGYNLTSR